MLISCARSRSHVAVPIFKLVGFIHSLMPRFLIHSNIAVLIFRLSIGSHIPKHKKKASVILRQSKARRLLLLNWLQSYSNEEEVWRSDLLDRLAQRGKSLQRLVKA